MASSCCSSSSPNFLLCSPHQRGNNGRTAHSRRFQRVPSFVTVASAVDSSSESSSAFAKRIERAWLISQQPRPIACSSCESKGYKECQWCNGTGFFILGNNMLCQIPSRSNTCVVCTGKGNACCPDCKGTGYRAKWLEESSR